MSHSSQTDDKNIDYDNRTNMKQVLTFAMIGVFNTIVDISIFNLLAFGFNLPLLFSNILSVSVAMFFSYGLNSRFTFSKQHDKRTIQQFIVFVVVTAMGVYVIQNLVIYLFTTHWTTPASVSLEMLAQFTDLDIDMTVFIANFAKALAIGFGMIWNFLLYKYVVFKR